MPQLALKLSRNGHVSLLRYIHWLWSQSSMMIEGGSRIKDFMKGSTVYLPQLRKSTVFSSEAEGMHVFFFLFLHFAFRRAIYVYK